MYSKDVKNNQISNDKKSNTVSEKKQSVFGTLEWASSNVNIINGCSHDCKYCYAKEMAIRFKRKTPDTWKEEKIRTAAVEKNYKKTNGTIMFPSSHDISPENLSCTIKTLRKILASGNDLLIVTKPHYQCIEEICKELEVYKHNILFRFTIGSAKSSILKFWEPGAADYEERLKAVKHAYENGFKTSISCEPMLDNKIGLVIEDTLPFVTDSIWIGKANFLLRRLKMNGSSDEKTTKKAEQLIKWQCDKNIIKLYNAYCENPKIKWKESIKNVVGISLASKKGLDV